MPSPSSPPSPSTQDFQDALALFADESKPDHLARRQIANLILEWTPSVADPPADETDDAEDHKANEVDNNWESKQLCGALKVFGDNMVVSINSNCEWRWRPQTKDDDWAHASLTFRLTASAKFIPQSQHKRLQKERQNKQNGDAAVSADGGDTEQSPKADRKEQRAQTKIRSGMINRLQKDYYIQRLLAEATASDDGNGDRISTGDQHHRTICEAEIKESFDLDGTVTELEERVDASEDVLEGVRRATLSMLDDNTSVLDLLLSFPYLLNTEVENKRDGKGNTIGLQLGHRAALRLLEDACIDACEKEGEDEMLDDLQISAGNNEGNGSSDDEEGAAVSRKKRSKR